MSVANSPSPVGPAGFGGRRARNQSGYVLGVVLAAMGVGLTVITALLGLSFATHSSAISQQSLAREARAADGALEVGVVELRASDSPVTDCPTIPGTVSMQLLGDASDPTDPEEDVLLSCTAALDPNPNVNGDLKVLGDEYRGQALASPLDLVDSSVTLRHQGESPLTFVGDVRVSGAGAVAGPGPGPGAWVSGRYVQGAGSDCPSSSDHPADPGRVLVDADDGGSPTCGDPGVAAQTVPLNLPPKPGNEPAVPECSPPGVASVDPGLYGPVAVSQLNSLLDSGCDVRFAPTGSLDVFWFDAGEKGSIDFTSEVNYVFGSDPGGAGSCDPAQPGVTVVLGAGTSVDHQAGNVSMCAVDGWPALAQAADAHTQPELTMLASGLGPGDPTGSAAADPEAWPSGLLPVLGQPSNLLVEAEIGFPGGGDVDSLALRFKSFEDPRSFPANRKLNVLIDDGPGTPVICQMNSLDRGRVDDHMETIVDLGSCPNALKAGNHVLHGKRIRVLFHGDGVVGSELHVAELGLLVNGVVIRPELATGTYTDPGLAVDDPDSGYAHGGEQNCSVLWSGIDFPHVCSRSGGVPEHDLHFRIPDLSGTERVQEVRLLLDIADQAMGLPAAVSKNVTASRGSPGPGKTTVAVAECDAESVYDTYARSEQTVSLAVPLCGVATIDDLSDRTVSMTVLAESTMDAEWECLGCTMPAGVELPWIQDARLLVITGEPTDPPSIKLTIDEENGSIFRVVGDTVLPETNLDVVWAGSASSEPLFGGQLSVWSLGSKGEPGSSVGVLCCGTDEPTLVLEAELDHDEDGEYETRGVARIRVKDDPAPGTVTVSDWQLCDRSGCDAEVVSRVPAQG